HLKVMLEVIATRTNGPGAAPREVFYQPERSPIADAVCLDELFFAPALTAEHPITGKLPDGFEAQLRGVFPNMQQCLKAAGLTLENVAHVTVYMQDINWKPILNKVWTELFPDPNTRPPHKYVPVAFDDQRILAQLQVFAVRGAQPRVLEIPGLVHGDPMSMAAQTGNLLLSSRIVGTDTATGQTPADQQHQADTAFANMQTLLHQAGASLDSLTQVIAFINDSAGQQATQTAWDKMFADKQNRPSLHFLNAHLPGNTTVRLEIIAAC
ncbi:MAG: hypothetical protein LC797_22820, partial [Chloroflexi bacterium]|nr:hypothetical protein [Chloroflexota bacterium]